MEWVETTAKSIEEAREQALDRLGVGEDEAEFEILDSPKSGLFGRMRGEARVRARVRPTAVRPKQDRRSRGRKPKPDSADGVDVDAAPAVAGDALESDQSSGAQSNGKRSSGQRQSNARDRDQQRRDRTKMDTDATDSSEPQPSIDPEQVGAAAVEFMTGLTNAFGSPATAQLSSEGTELEVRVEGDELGLLIGPGGRTLLAVQDLARVASQRRLGDHETRLRIDIAGYRERRRAALEKFATAVADEVQTSGRSKALEPMPSADRKVIHDVVQGIEGVTSHSDGEEPRRRVVIAPA